VQRGRVPPIRVSREHIKNLMVNPSMEAVTSARATEIFQHSPYVRLLLRAETLPSIKDYRYTKDYATIGMDNMSELAARLLFSAVEWARNIPFFPDFELTDRIALLRLVWSELFILNASQCSLSFQITTLLTTAELYASPTTIDRVIRYMDHIQIFQEQIGKFSALHIDAVEYSCLKAVVLFTP
ncbi:hypothetical protein QAD02_003154, partial [Eretmocerus hayati]